MQNLNMQRLRVANYFDDVVAEVDLFTETELQKLVGKDEDGEVDSAEVNRWNRRREEQIEAIRRCEQACYLHLSKSKIDDDDNDASIFVEYCFTLDHFGMLYVIKTDQYVSPDEKCLLHKVIKLSGMSESDKLKTLITGMQFSSQVR